MERGGSETLEGGSGRGREEGESKLEGVRRGEERGGPGGEGGQGGEERECRRGRRRTRTNRTRM